MTSIPDSSQRILLGMAIQGNLALPVANANTFVVPRDALTRRGNEWLFVVNDNQAQQLNVETIAEIGQEVAIANPELREGQSAMVTGKDGLTDNAVVQVFD